MCFRCPKGKAAAQLHHRRPRGMGSSDRTSTNLPSNLIWLCEECHRWIESNRLVALEQGYLVPQHAEPYDVGVLHGRYGMVMLGNDGQIYPMVF